MTKKTDSTDPFEIITRSLNSYQGRQKSTSDHLMIQCPYHDDNSPSLGVYIAEGMSIPIGSWNCFGCHESGSWNKLAEKCGFPTFKDWSTQTNYTKQVALIEDIDYTLSSLMQSMRVAYNAWPNNISWRGFDGDLINQVGGILVDDAFTESVGLFFPVYIGKSLKGGVKAALKKKKNTLSYVTTKGNWVKKYGLFLFEQVKAMRKSYVILTEGPRDALRLFEQNLPALAILGSQNFGPEKALLLSSLNASTVIVIPDNDAAGRDMKKLIKTHMSKYSKVVAVRLPKNVKDPCAMSDDDITQLKHAIKNLK